MVVLATQPKRQRLRFAVDIPFTKQFTGDKGDLELVGYASTWVEDRDGEYVDPRAFDKSLEQYLATNPIVLWQHNQDWPFGRVLEARVDANGLAVRVAVRKPEGGEEPWKLSAFNDVKAGIVCTFSIGGFFARDFIGGRQVIVEVELMEISVVSIPSNPVSIFEAAVKAVEGGSRPVLPQRAVEQMAQLLGLRGMSDAELRGMAGDEALLDARYELLCGLYTKAGRQPPGREVWQEAKRVPDPRQRLARIVDVMQAVQGNVAAAKAGRVLSASNEGRLRKATEALDAASAEIKGVLAQLPESEAATPGAAAVHDYRGDGGPCAICGKPHDDPVHGKAAGADGKGTTPTFKDFPLAARARLWDGAAAQARVRAATGATEAPTRGYADCHFWINDTGVPANYGDCHLLFCDVVGGKVVAVPRGIFACAVIMQGGRGGRPKDMPSGDVAKVQAHMARYYAKMAKEFGDPDIKPPWV